MEVVNTQLAEIEISILQASKDYKTQTVGDIFSISKDLQNIIQEDIESQAYYIQTLLANELDRCKERRNTYADNHIKDIQEAYKRKDQENKQQMIIDKEKETTNSSSR